MNELLTTMGLEHFSTPCVEEDKEINKIIKQHLRLSIAQIDQLIKQEIIIDSKKHCYQERRKRQALREIARKALMKKHGYE